MAGFIRAAGAILALSYPVLALSTGVRAIYQIVEGDPSNAPWITLTGALLYTIAAIGFAKQPRPEPKRTKAKPPSNFILARWWRAIAPAQAWRVSLIVLALETCLALLVGILSYTHPGLIGRNVWQFFGKDYGYFPLIQPLLGLAWLLHPETIRLYGLRTKQP
ncbi:MAG: hypothetical protein H6662_14465 [Ardenticatenaceae bacterium]|nr:hypothetical protein [Ardenticatenaceae bacterium]MCB8991921.1 hypothetical protein [Ardenticatenaceae bacterium]MCB9004731.1 hypothetical protein [Ardenticatenaceae bacterium]